MAWDWLCRLWFSRLNTPGTPKYSLTSCCISLNVSNRNDIHNRIYKPFHCWRQGVDCFPRYFAVSCPMLRTWTSLMVHLSVFFSIITCPLFCIHGSTFMSNLLTFVLVMRAGLSCLYCLFGILPLHRLHYVANMPYLTYLCSPRDLFSLPWS